MNSMTTGLPPINFSQSTNSSSLIDAVGYLQKIYPPLFLLVGVPGNLVSLVIWLRRIKTAPGSTCLFLTLMCATDTYVLTHGCLRLWFKALQDFDLRHFLGCSAPLFIFTFLSDFSVWIIILLCIERTICVWLPMKAKQLCCVKHGALAVLAVVVVLAILHLHFFWTVSLQRDAEGLFCGPTRMVFAYFVKEVWHYIDFAFYSFIPLTFILILNLLILFGLHRQASRLQNSRSNRSGKILRTIVWMTIAHFAFTMPIVIYFLASQSGCSSGASMMDICDLIETLCVMLQMTNHLIHFFIYSLTSSLFTSDLARMCPWIACLVSQRERETVTVRRQTKLTEEFEFRAANNNTTSTNGNAAATGGKEKRKKIKMMRMTKQKNKEDQPPSSTQTANHV